VSFSDGAEISEGATHSYKPSKYSSFRQSQTKLYRNNINPETWDPGVMSQLKPFRKVGSSLDSTCTCTHANTHTDTPCFFSETTVGILLSCIELCGTNYTNCTKFINWFGCLEVEVEISMPKATQSAMRRGFLSQFYLIASPLMYQIFILSLPHLLHLHAVAFQQVM